jgi:hypothetical protein
VARATHLAARHSTTNIQSIPKQEENCPERAIAFPEIFHGGMFAHTVPATECPTLFSLFLHLSLLHATTRESGYTASTGFVPNWREAVNPPRAPIATTSHSPNAIASPWRRITNRSLSYLGRSA